jgi:Type I restriction modification DNA specificity domain/N-6 DNA Methylase
MKKESEIQKDVLQYLKSLGYGSESLKYEVKTPTDRRVDLLVSSGDDNLIAIEIKSDPVVLNKIGDIGFSPIARQLQRMATELEARNYMITNGIDHIWLKTNEYGRPIVTDPIPASEIYNNKLTDSEFIYALMDHVSSYLTNFPITGNLSYDLSIIIYHKILVDLNISDDKFHSGIMGVSAMFHQDHVYEVLKRWEDLNFIKDKLVVLKYIDDFLLKSKTEWQVPRWLANLMVNLYPENKPKNELLDIFAKYGVLVSSAHLHGWKNVNSFYFNQDNEYWIRIQQLITNEEYVDATFSPDLLTHHDLGIVDDKYNCVLVAPPFGHRITSNFGKNKIDSIELLIDKAIQRCQPNGWIIAIVLDGILLSTRFKKFRNTLLKRHSIKGIINLTPDTFKPYSAVSTSLIIIQKDKTDLQRTFLGSLDEVPRSSDISNNNLLAKWRLFVNGDDIQSGKDGFIIDKLDIDNFHFSNYWFSKYQDGLEELQSKYQAIPLKELIYSIKRGSPFKKNKKEDIPYISPAVVRAMKLQQDGLSYTSQETVPSKPTIVEKQDVLVNIIGTQKGSAALVTDEFKGLGINQHIVVLKPNLDIVRPYYLALALNSEYVQKQLEEGSTGSVIPALSLKSFESLHIPVPPFSIQDKIIENYQKILTRVEQQQKEFNTQKQKLNKLLSDLGKEGDTL